MERVVEVEVPVTVVKEVDVEMLPKGSSWAKALTQLAEQLDRGLVYDRDLTDLARSLEAATEALSRRPLVAGASRHLTSHSALHGRMSRGYLFH